MSWFAYWPARKKNGQVAVSSSAIDALRTPCQRRIAKYSPAPISQAPIIDPKRAANGVMSVSRIATMSIQYSSGGLWKNGSPFSVGTSRSPCNISRATFA